MPVAGAGGIAFRFASPCFQRAILCARTFRGQLALPNELASPVTSNKTLHDEKVSEDAEYKQGDVIDVTNRYLEGAQYLC